MYTSTITLHNHLDLALTSDALRAVLAGRWAIGVQIETLEQPND
jgi:hypothetical protein